MAAANHNGGAIKILQDIQGVEVHKTDNSSQISSQTSFPNSVQSSTQAQEKATLQGSVTSEQVQTQGQSNIQSDTVRVESIEQQNKPKLEYRNSEDFH